MSCQILFDLRRLGWGFDLQSPKHVLRDQLIIVDSMNFALQKN